MNETLLEVIPINDLLGRKFFVPSYQRGYRWTKRQVKELLNDIWEFRKKSESASKDEFYCLQPIVVAPLDGEWILIDGQQRITTIYLILRYLNDILSMIGKSKFVIRYETRNESQQFLEDLSESERNRNVDFYHIYEAYVAIDEWFSSKDGTAKINFLTTLLNDNESGKNVQVIWYEISAEINAIDIFTRINIGKIPLTNAELIKSLFLGKLRDNELSDDEIELKRVQIASEWDKIEYTLQDDAFWYFIYEGNEKYETRIEFIFDLMKGKPEDAEDYYTFHKFSEEFESVKNIGQIWLAVKQYFQTFEEWYYDKTLYHLIGYLIATGYPIIDLKSNSANITKTQFRAFLKQEIGKKIPDDFEELQYKDKELKPLFLLFNIQTILSNPKSILRFPFDNYKRENGWDIEHIRSVKSAKPTGNDKRHWLKNVLEYFTGTDQTALQPAEIALLKDGELSLAGATYALLQGDKITDTEFNELYEKILKHFNENSEPENINSISNLTLLDSSTNRSYKNAVFTIKRQTIMKNDMNGTFIPICTKNVFLKSYSRKFSNVMYWQENDANDYLQSIKVALSAYKNNLQSNG